MTKPTIVTRAGKGSALTWTEGDANLTNLQNATLTVKAGTGGTDVVNDLNGTVTLVAGTNVTLSGDNTAKTVTINAAGGSGITDVVQDTTPQLGGDLDLNGYDITDTGTTPLLITSNTDKNVAIRSQGTGDVVLLPLGTGKVTIDTLNWPTSDGTSGQVLQTNGTGTLSWTTVSAGGITDVVQDTTPQLGGNLDVNDFSITNAGTTGDITIKPKSVTANIINLEGNQIYLGSPTTGTQMYITTANNKDLIFETYGGAAINLKRAVNGNVELWPSGTGRVQLGSTFFPSSLGTSGQYLQTDGAGNASWATVSAGGITDLVQDTTPQLGGSLDVNGQSIVSTANANINIVPNGTGDVYLTADTTVIGDNNTNATLTTYGTGNLLLNTNGGTGSAYVNIQQGNATLQVVGAPSGNILIATTGGSSYTTYLQRTDTAINNAPSAVFRRKRSDALLSALDGINVAFYANVEDSAAATTNFIRYLNTYKTAGTHNVQIQSSADGFSTNTQLISIEDSVLALGNTSGTTAQTVTTPRAANLVLNTNRGTNSGNITVTAGANGNISITPNGTGSVVLDGLNWPQADGTAGQILKTNGAGQLSWVDAGGGAGVGSVQMFINRGGSWANIAAGAYQAFDTLPDTGVDVLITRVSANTFTFKATGTYYLSYHAYGRSPTGTGCCFMLRNLTTSVNAGPNAGEVPIQYNTTGPTNDQYGVYNVLNYMRVITVTSTTHQYGIRILNSSAAVRNVDLYGFVAHLTRLT